MCPPLCDLIMITSNRSVRIVRVIDDLSMQESAWLRAASPDGRAILGR
ncbi:hypothetical protein Mal15_67320 [Stieleria maiorica]|uniref:Uncharacterized protein n=1 Tax=Stieleria maiorica TaxID=2795974 RepID=A0A5B9MQT4_9BACT|nr:hypothetical protein Mal15_67320 [Stieleria maiorica]